jgi:hypothetical protein
MRTPAADTGDTPPAAAPTPRRASLRLLAGLLAAAGILIVLAAGGFVLWAMLIPEPMPEALAALESDAEVVVDVGNPLLFRPVAEAQPCGLIFYPGGRVDVRAYAPALREIAAAGYLVAAPSMPLNLAVLAPNRASSIMAEQAGVERWVVGGHSLGGAMAATFVDRHPGAAAGLLLWAAYPAEGSGLAARDDLAVTSLYGTRDGLATVATVEASAARLPAATRFVAIEGGNHAQFGWYGDQRGDNPATIGRAEQQAQIVAESLRLLEQVCGPLSHQPKMARSGTVATSPPSAAD